jgi:biopolymer transport protein TolR
MALLARRVAGSRRRMLADINVVPEIVVRVDGQVSLREGGKQLAADLPGTVALIKKRQQAQPDVSLKPPVVIAADKDVRYEQVMKVMSALQKENIARVGLAVQPEK